MEGASQEAEAMEKERSTVESGMEGS